MSEIVAKGDLTVGDAEALELWLNTQPREVSFIIGARAALRVLPAAVLELPAQDPGRFLASISALFRAGALAWVASKYPGRANDLAAAALAANNAANAAVQGINNIARLTPLIGFKLSAAAYTGVATAYATLAVIVSAGNAQAAVKPAQAAANAARATAAVFDNAAKANKALSAAAATAGAVLALDANFIAQGGTIAELAVHPLWPDQTPPEVAGFWAELKAALPLGEDWEVWTHWYDERLKGAPSRREEYELFFAKVPGEVWNEGPAAVNRWIKEHLPKEPYELPPLENLPAQISAAAQFSEGGAGPIDVARDAASSDPSEAEDQREHYAEARQKALDLQSLGGNFLGDDLQRRVSRLLEVLPDDMDALSIVRLWHRANSLRERLADHDLAVERQGPRGEPDPAILAYAAAGPLRDFVKSYNIYIVGDDKGRELDRKSLGPGERERDEAAIAAMEPVIEALRSAPEVATEAVPEILQELSDAAKSAPKSLAGDQDVALARDSQGNFLIALIRKAHRWSKDETAFMSKEVRAAVYRGVGGVIAAGAVATCWPAAAHFIVERADALKAFATLVYNNPSVSQMIDAIAQHLLRGHI